jgi:hypothetical protein
MIGMRKRRIVSALLLCMCSLGTGPLSAIAQPPNAASIATSDFDAQVRQFLDREMQAHVADIHSLDPPQERVVGGLTTGDFSWGTFMRALALYAEMTGRREIAGRDIPRMVGEIGLIESRNGGKTWAQYYAAIALRSFGTDLAKNAVWQSLSPDGRQAWRALLDPARFYDREHHKLINLAENYYGVAARIAAISWQLGLLKDRAYVDQLLDEAAAQFVRGAQFSDDALPTGRYDRYSLEYARAIYEAAEIAGRKDIQSALAPSLKLQVRLWWDLVSPDGYAYPWGRSLGDTSYSDSPNIVAFLAAYPQFRPAPLPQLTSVYYAAWRSLRVDYNDQRHLLRILDFGHGHYSYITPQREWQQTTDFFGKLMEDEPALMKALAAERVATFPAEVSLPDVARFQFFREGTRPCGVWVVRSGALHFALPFSTGPKSAIADYLPAPRGFIGIGAPVEQQFPVLTPYLELGDGRTMAAADCADELHAAADGRSITAVWTRWAALAAKPGEVSDIGLRSEVTWTLEGNTVRRSETLIASKPLHVRRWWMAVPSTLADLRTTYAGSARTDTFSGPSGTLSFRVVQSDWPIQISVTAPGDGPLGRGDRGAIPLYLMLDARDLDLYSGAPVLVTFELRAVPSKPSDGN